MTNKTRPRIASALLAGAFAVVPLAATVALAPSAAAIEIAPGSEGDFDIDLDALAEVGIAPAMVDLEPISAELDESVVGEDGELDRSHLARTGEDGVVDFEPISAEVDAEDAGVDIEPISIEPISADISTGLSTGAIVAIVAGGVVVLGTGTGLGLRARKAKANA